MADSISIGLACRDPRDRDLFMKWLAAAGYTPVRIADLASLTSELERRPIEALVADAEVVAKAGLPSVMKALTANRPLLILGDLHACPPELRRHPSWLDRASTPDVFTISVALALAEGRPSRRSPRKAVLYLPATVNGVSSHVVDVSDEGVRLQLHKEAVSALPPFFTLRVEAFNVAALVQRVWVTRPGNPIVACGGRIQKQLPKSATWTHLVTLAPLASGRTPAS